MIQRKTQNKTQISSLFPAGPHWVRRKRLLLLAIACVPWGAHAQWQMQRSGTTADLRGITKVNQNIAWASGTHGTVLRTLDAGAHWQQCAIPAGAESLDFRGVQAFDADTAFVLSSGKGDQSRLYRTTHGCKSWELLVTNPEQDGFWDGLRATSPEQVEILGDAIDTKMLDGRRGPLLRLWSWRQGRGLHTADSFGEIHADPDESAFAASNSVLVYGTRPPENGAWRYTWIASGDAKHTWIHRSKIESTATCEPCAQSVLRVEAPMAQGSATAGIFSLAFRQDLVGVAVGGDFQHPDATTKTAAYSKDGGVTWALAATLPGGYRSAVAYLAATKIWIAVGPNGTDLSHDDGLHWQALHPSSEEEPDADKQWNALALPFVVGPKGRIGILQAATR